MADPVQLKYRAFLSYAHKDTAWAKWLHKSLEAFRIDKDLAGRVTALGPVPATLRPIFRDRDDFSGGATLTAATVAALDQSAALVVLCTPRSAASPYVNEEVRLFRSRHPARPVIPVIADGTPPECFPPALRFELGADGTVTDRPVTILAPDLRDTGDGRDLALAKVVASLIGVPSDDVFRRAERERRRQRRIKAAVGAVIAVLAMAGGGLAWLSRQQSVEIAATDRLELFVLGAYDEARRMVGNSADERSPESQAGRLAGGAGRSWSVRLGGQGGRDGRSATPGPG